MANTARFEASPFCAKAPFKAASLGLMLLGISHCQRRPPEPESERAPEVKVATPKPKAPTPPVANPSREANPPGEQPGGEGSGDPLNGKFTLEDATHGMAPGKTLTATLETDMGTLKCELFPDRAPITVANFVGLSRGLRPFKDASGTWVKRPGYDGTTFHRVIKGFMIQGGDPRGTGQGEPGYVIPDERWDGATHDRRGQLCMANRGPNTNGMQFFITDKAAPHLDRSYTIFGQCGPDSVMDKLVNVKVQGDHSLEPTKIKKVSIARK